jgi:hypothetical protein
MLALATEIFGQLCNQSREKHIIFCGFLIVVLQCLHWHRQNLLSPNKYDIFQKENLAVKLEAKAKKFYTMACHLRSEPALVALLENELEKKDISRFCRTYLDSGALYKLEAQDCLAIVFAYTSGDLQTVFMLKSLLITF